jgi:hypothetical protein
MSTITATLNGLPSPHETSPTRGVRSDHGAAKDRPLLTAAEAIGLYVEVTHPPPRLTATVTATAATTDNRGNVDHRLTSVRRL